MVKETAPASLRAMSAIPTNRRLLLEWLLHEDRGIEQRAHNRRVERAEMMRHEMNTKAVYHEPKEKHVARGVTR